MLDLTTETTHEDLLRSFQWRLPERFNIAEAVCGRHAVATPERTAVITVDEDGQQTTVSYGTLDQEVRCVARGLRDLGVVPGDRVAVRLDQGVPALTAALGAIWLGAIAVPIPPAFSGDAVVFRLRDCRVKVLVTDALRTEEAEVVEAVVVAGEASVFPGGETETGAVAQTSPDDPALLFYTSGSTGPPKGVMHGQRVLLGHVPGFQLMFDGAPEEGDVFWTPSVWAWQGSLGDLVLPALYFGCAVVATPGRYSSEREYQILSEAGITRAFLATAVLRRLASEPPAEPPRTTLRSICTGGDPLPPGFRDMVRDVFGVRVNDDYGLTETSHIAVGCSILYDTPEGAIGSSPDAGWPS